MKVTLLINNPDSWLWEYIYDFKAELEAKVLEIRLASKNEDLVSGGEIAFFLACTRIVPEKYLKYHKYNFVIHHSDLPKGKGSSPLVWQVLEGKKEIVFTMFDAVAKVDSGLIYHQHTLILDGTELFDELFLKRWKVEKKMVLDLLEKYPDIYGKPQLGVESYYPRRNSSNDEISVDLPIKRIFNQLRVANNEKWPAFFNYLGQKYILKIYKADNKD